MKHYQQREKESIEIIKDALSKEEFRGFLLGNVYKYLNRYRYKGEAVNDIAKAIHYLQALEYLLYDPDCSNVFEALRQQETDYQHIKHNDEWYRVSKDGDPKEISYGNDGFNCECFGVRQECEYMCHEIIKQFNDNVESDN